VTFLAYLVLYVILATTGLVLLRRSLAGAEIPGVVADPQFLLGAAAYAASFLTFLLSLRQYEVLTVFPVFFGVAYAAVTLAAVLVLGEGLSVTRAAGLVLVGTGVLLLLR